MNLGIKPADQVEAFGVFNCKIEVWSHEKRIFTAAKLEDKDGMEREALSPILSVVVMFFLVVL